MLPMMETMYRAPTVGDISFATAVHRLYTRVPINRTMASTPTPRNASISLLTALFVVVGCVLFLYKYDLKHLYSNVPLYKCLCLAHNVILLNLITGDHWRQRGDCSYKYLICIYSLESGIEVAL